MSPSPLAYTVISIYGRGFSMEPFNVYKDIQLRTGGDIYIGVVGPVRTGKSTFIKRFMNLMVLPNMEDVHDRERTKDELPQSAGGKTIMTTEPKFIPKEAAQIAISPDVEVNMRLIDCVGYMVEGAAGHIENDEERLVKTPWFDYEIPFTQAAEIGTKKVINDHSTIGVVVTTDGSFSEIPREAYEKAEDKTIQELKKLGKPFVVLLNSSRPYSEETSQLCEELAQRYQVAVLPVNCEQLKKEDICHIMEEVLKCFPVSQVDFHIPKWLEILPATHWLKAKVMEMAMGIISKITYMRDADPANIVTDLEEVQEVKIDRKDLSCGRVSLRVDMKPSLYYNMISEYTGIPVAGEYQLLKTLKDFSQLKDSYSKVQNAMESVRYKGYGVVIPDREEIVLDEPAVIKHGNKFGVKMRAEAPSIHLMQSVIETEIAPIVGSEQQAQDLIQYIKGQSAEENGIWEANIFGKSIEQIVEDGIQAKVAQMTDDCQQKLQDAIKKVINDSNGGMICIII